MSSDDIRREIIIRNFARKGISANETLRTLKQQGLGLRRQNFLRLYNQILREENYIEYIRRANKLKNLKDLPKAKISVFDTPYNYKVRVVYEDPSGKEREAYVGFHSLRPMSRNELETRAFDFVQNAYVTTKVIKIQLVDAWSI